MSITSWATRSHVQQRLDDDAVEPLVVVRRVVLTDDQPLTVRETDASGLADVHEVVEVEVPLLKRMIPADLNEPHGNGDVLRVGRLGFEGPVDESLCFALLHPAPSSEFSDVESLEPQLHLLRRDDVLDLVSDLLGGGHGTTHLDCSFLDV